MRQSVSIPFAAVRTEKITKAEGRRLKAYIESRWTRAEGGMTALAEKASIRRPTLYAWFRAEDAPNMASLRTLAAALGVTRADLVAAMDATPADAVTGLSESAVAALAGEIGAEVAGVLAARLPQLLDATSPDDANPRTRGKRQPMRLPSSGR